ncbi:MAG TPA: hypothetical protein VE825_12880 [Terriglobales bacterium]|jgi:hypothetical protein|nr:hypothetical protein [Terriglobales bacterium]
MFCPSCGKPMDAVRLRCPACHRGTPALWLNLFALLILGAVAAGAYVHMTYLLPVLANLCAGLGIEMVLPARVYAQAARWVQDYGIWVLLAGIALLVLLRWRRGAIPGFVKSGKLLAALTWLALLATLAGILAAFTMTLYMFPNLVLIRTTMNQRSAIVALWKLNAAEAAYRKAHPKQGFTCQLSELQPPSAPGAAVDQLYYGQRSGYAFTLAGCAGAPAETYQATATPIAFYTTGRATFCSDPSGVVRAFKESSANPAGDCAKQGQPIGPADEP